IDLKIPKSIAANTVVAAKNAASEIGYPVMIRAGFSLGGQDSGVAKNKRQLVEIATRALSKLNQILIEEYLALWKEVEYEVVRDRFDNCITVCNMENIDPMGIHTGESIVVAPSQTLNNFEYHRLREISIKVIRHLGIIGECNIQFALNPNPKSGGSSGRDPDSAELTEQNQNTLRVTSRRALAGGKRLTGPDFGDLDYRIIEVNARLSRSSALASKATGYPLAYIAAKLALDRSLIELKNSVTKKTIAAFEPALDYLVVKFPRWDFAKFIKSQSEIGTSMQSVGEVMAIGRKFEEAVQKAVRMLDIGFEGILDEKSPDINWQKPTPWRIFSIARAIKNNTSVEKIYKVSGIDPFFLAKLKNIVELEKDTSGVSLQRLDQPMLQKLKQYGFSDTRIAKLTNSTPEEVRTRRKKFKLHPAVKQIDTLAAEYPAATNYLYLTYNGESDDIDEFTVHSSQFTVKNKTVNRQPSTVNKHNHKVIVLGSGPYRIGSSVEFDWCSVTCAQISTQNGLSAIIVNCNPETVSTDYDMAQRLYFEELTEETVAEIYQKENPKGIIVSMGGQTPNNLVPKLAKSGLKILGTKPSSIDRAEDRSKFSKLCDSLKINQPVWNKLKNIKEAVAFAEKIDYPVLIRPSYVLSGTAMNVAFNSGDLKEYLSLAARISTEYPVVISKFHQNAKEVEIDAVAADGKILCWAISEHVENAGVHSGDSSMVLPAQKLHSQTVKQIEEITHKIARSLTITGPFNIQFLAQNNQVMVIECNLRASRSLPFVSKVTGINFAKVATEAILDKLSTVNCQLS
ncbi:carbamoyl-phosphate synthase large subunit, partial [Candidatus Curtissbacteria bacterium]|nr:carbamoyl-phosphate synthase large subunit [Candidatus Curtissbacteria bacterium]